MKIAKVPDNEEARLRILEETHLLDTLPEPEFDSFTKLAAFICDTPTALISLVDGRRQWFKSRVGLDATETPRELAFCAHAILQHDVFEVPDSTQDERFADNPLSTGMPYVRFYAGAPLVTPDGAALGTLCVIDKVPRKLSEKQREALMALGQQVIAQVQLRRTAAKLAQANQQLRKAEEQHRATSEWLKDFLDHANDLVQGVTPDGRLTYVNPAWREALGYPEGEALPDSIMSVIDPESHGQARALFAKLAQGEKLPLAFSLFFRAKGGRRLEVEGNLSCRFEDGEPVLIRGIFRDVTLRREAERTLVAQSAELRAQARLLDLANDAIMVVGRDQIIRYYNHGAEVLYGWSREEALGQRAQELLRSTYPTPNSVIESKLRAEGAWDGEVSHLRKDGAKVTVASRWALVRDGQGAPVEVLQISRDITARKEVDRMKNEFISTVSHELRTPLTSIRGALGLLEGGVAGELSPDAREFVQIARDNSDRLIRLVNDILDLEKIEAGKLELKLARLEPSRLVHKAIEGMRGFAVEAGVKVELDLHGSARIEGDEDRLVQVLTNLLSNAVKFSPKGAGVRAVVRTTPLGRIRFSVVDSGPGIAPEQMRKLFQKFQQLDQSDRRQQGGTGLGLAISKAIVEQHAGQIGVDSIPGKGSEFWFELPALHSSSQPVAAGEAVGKHTLLVVEDDPMMLRLLTLQLKAEGYHVLGAGSVKEAEELLARTRPAAMVLDVFLPDGNGIEFLQALRRRDEFHELPVIVLSGGEPTAGTFGAPLLIDWLSKPFDEVRLRKALRRAVRRPGSPRALVVEDDPSFRTIVATQLRAIGVEALEAADGAEAVQLAKTAQPDLIILDLAMPRVDGFAVVEALRQDKARTTPLIVYSGRDLSSEDRHELSLGMTHYLTKARTNESDFIDSVRELLNGIMLDARRPKLPARDEGV